jgi:hypothetical protein
MFKIILMLMLMCRMSLGTPIRSSVEKDLTEVTGVLDALVVAVYNNTVTMDEAIDLLKGYLGTTALTAREVLMYYMHVVDEVDTSGEDDENKIVIIPLS